ncbi:hypothetical protein [Actinoplanes sp. CA-252034]|uniref:hypothetical protein n=1 Tax=Actinoplanes sp. CA-252034 TaxID=3239906 RepID=UPI003D98ED02
MSDPAPMTAAAEQAGLGPHVASAFVRERPTGREWLALVIGRGPARRWFGHYDGGLVRYVDGNNRARAWKWAELEFVSIDPRTEWVRSKPRQVHRLVVRVAGRVYTNESRARKFRLFAVRVAVAFADDRAAREISRIKGDEIRRYGPYAVDLHGIEAHGERLPWSSVNEIYLRAGTIAVYRRGDEARPWSEENWWGEVDVMTFMSVVAEFVEDRS